MDGFCKDKPINILLIEDNPDHAELIQRAFHASLHAVRFHLLSDGKHALEYIRELSRLIESDCEDRLPDFILLDIKLPKYNGYQIAKAIKSHPPLKSIPIIILTTSSRREDREQMQACGVETFITKPGHYRGFLKVIDQIKVLVRPGLSGSTFKVPGKRNQSRG